MLNRTVMSGQIQQLRPSPNFPECVWESGYVRTITDVAADMP